MCAMLSISLHMHVADSPPATLYIYPSANWVPFFRRHAYRFGPIVAANLLPLAPQFRFATNFSALASLKAGLIFETGSRFVSPLLPAASLPSSRFSPLHNIDRPAHSRFTNIEHASLCPQVLLDCHLGP